MTERSIDTRKSATASETSPVTSTDRQRLVPCVARYADTIQHTDAKKDMTLKFE